MKFRTFRNLVIAGGVIVLSGLGYGVWTLASYLGSGIDEQPSNIGTKRQVESSQPSGPASAPALSDAGAGNSEGQTVDQRIVEYLKRPATTDKIKDAFPSENYKVNIYRDAGSTSWTRVKVDLDRDEMDDEKWDLQDGKPWKRRISTRDDGSYDVEYRWRDGVWEQKQ